jgi:hypothetical protein
MAPEDTTKDPAAKAAALALLTKGLATKAEAARLAGVSKQLMQHWAAEIDTERNRNALLAKLWRKELRNRKR